MPRHSPPEDGLDRMVHYLVDTADGSVGVLDEWERDECGRPTALTVAQGWFGRRRVSIPIGCITRVDHPRRRITIARGRAPLERHGTLARMLGLNREIHTEEHTQGAGDPAVLE